jgi:hypothetical protein
VNTPLESKVWGRKRDSMGPLPARFGMRLVFRGWQDDGAGGRFRLWDVHNSPRPDLHPDGSTVSEYTVDLLIRSQIVNH